MCLLGWGGGRGAAVVRGERPPRAWLDEKTFCVLWPALDVLESSLGLF